MSGRLTVIGLGPGDAAQVTPEASAALAAATDFYGYAPYLDRLALREDQRRHASDNREELDRAQVALTRAAAGVKVCMVSGGDPDGQTDILVSEAYRWAFTRQAQYGYAAAYAVLIFLLLFGVTRLADRRGRQLVEA